MLILAPSVRSFLTCVILSPVTGQCLIVLQVCECSRLLMLGPFTLVPKRCLSLVAGLLLGSGSQLIWRGLMPLKKEPELNDHLVSIAEHIPVEDHTALGQGQQGRA